MEIEEKLLNSITIFKYLDDKDYFQRVRRVRRIVKEIRKNPIPCLVLSKDARTPSHQSAVHVDRCRRIHGQ